MTDLLCLSLDLRACATTATPLAARWKYSLQGDIEIERQIRLQVVVRLVTARGGEGVGTHRHQWRSRTPGKVRVAVLRARQRAIRRWRLQRCEVAVCAHG